MEVVNNLSTKSLCLCRQEPAGMRWPDEECFFIGVESYLRPSRLDFFVTCEASLKFRHKLRSPTDSGCSTGELIIERSADRFRVALTDPIERSRDDVFYAKKLRAYRSTRCGGSQPVVNHGAGIRESVVYPATRQTNAALKIQRSSLFQGFNFQKSGVHEC